MFVWGHAFNWAELAAVWLFTVAIGIAIHFLPVAQRLEGLQSEQADERVVLMFLIGKGGGSPLAMQCSLV